MDKVRLHLGDGLAPISDCGNKRCTELLIRSYCTAGQNFTSTNTVTRQVPPGMPRLISLSTRVIGLQTCRQEILIDEGAVTNPAPTYLTPRLQWMLESSICMIEECPSLLCNPQHNRKVEGKLTKSVRRSLLVESRRKTEKAA